MQNGQFVHALADVHFVMRGCLENILPKLVAMNGDTEVAGDTCDVKYVSFERFSYAQ